jgi:formylglycine-generating enzyme required for sulfatase activity
MVVIPAGSFMMGSPASASERGWNKRERPQHRVTIGKPFAVGKYEVTQAEWRSVMNTNPSRFKGDRNPVERTSWDDAQAFVMKLSAKAGKRYRLLSEAEWEYAARAGTTTPFHTGATITTGQANYDGDYTYNGSPKGEDRQRTVAVGSFPANAFGLHDMHGNVWEWVGDCWNKAYHGAPTDGGIWSAGDCRRRVLRGGSWYLEPWSMRAANRGWDPSGNRYSGGGFRIARTLF